MDSKGLLFGGAIAVDNFPEHLIDASYVSDTQRDVWFHHRLDRDLRQIPDNQEVFLYPDSNVSIIIEVLQRVPEPNDAEAIM